MFVYIAVLVCCWLLDVCCLSLLWHDVCCLLCVARCLLFVAVVIVAAAAVVVVAVAVGVVWGYGSVPFEKLAERSKSMARKSTERSSWGAGAD